MFEQVKETHPLVYSHFSALWDGERHLRHLLTIDRYWDDLGEPVPSVIRDGSEMSPATPLSASFDLFYAGGTLGLLHAAVMVKKYGRRVIVVDRETPARSSRDWNISRSELLRLVETGVFSEEEIDSVIVRKYRSGWVEFNSPAPSRKRLYIDDVLDCAVDTDRLLEIARQKIIESGLSVVMGGTQFVRCYRFDDHVVVQVRQGNGEPLFFRADLLVDAMGILSPVAMQLNQGRPQTHVCPTVGTVASGFLDVDYDIGEILASTGPAEISKGGARQFIWEGFPSRGTDYITYLFFYDEVDSGNDKSLLGLFEAYFRKLPEYKKPGPEFTIRRPVYGIIPAYFHDGFTRTRQIADDRIILLGDAASLASPLTFCGFGSMVRNLHRLTADLDTAMREGRLAKSHLEEISAYEPNVASMANLMKYMCYDPRIDEPNIVNELMNEVMIVLDELPPRYRQTMFRDEMTLEDLATVMLRLGLRYPKVFRITWEKLGIGGMAGFMKNIVGWAFSSTK